MTTDFRALAAELLAWAERTSAHYVVPPHVILRARAALSAPEQVSPQCVADGCLEEAARQEPGGPMQQLLSEAGGLLAGWNRPAVKPVPVSERLPRPEDLDDQGRCWWLDRPLKNGPAAWMLRRPDDWLLIPFIAWAPHWALPMPQEGADG